MVARLILILGDQLSHNVSALRAMGPRDVIVMSEVTQEATYVAHHPKKIALIFSAMRKFAQELSDQGIEVIYTRFDDAQNTGSITGELLRHAASLETDEVVATQPGEWRLIHALQDCPLSVTLLPDDRFLCSQREFSQWAEGRKELRMEFFYREMRRKTRLLMTENKPVGGKWNYDRDNRKKAPKGAVFPSPLRFSPDPTTKEVLSLVTAHFGANFGDTDDFWFATTRTEARAALDHFIDFTLPGFGDTQDAMLQNEPFLAHSLLSAYLNIGLLNWQEICGAAEKAWRQNRAPLNAVEGFIRQIIGWREFMRGIYFHYGPDYVKKNELGHDRDLPSFFWDGDTDMSCIAAVIRQTRQEAYAHHIQRLMVTGNFALLAGVDPFQTHGWYLAVYADAFEWVEAPNVIGMSQFADGGIVGSKPYVSSGNYINKMSDYCAGCAYDVQQKTGAQACPFNLLYWDFLHRHRDRFSKNPRMAQIYRNWERMEDQKRTAILADAAKILTRLDNAERV